MLLPGRVKSPYRDSARSGKMSFFVPRLLLRLCFPAENTAFFRAALSYVLFDGILSMQEEPCQDFPGCSFHKSLMMAGMLFALLLSGSCQIFDVILVLSERDSV
jgi:hypothetical protein